MKTTNIPVGVAYDNATESEKEFNHEHEFVRATGRSKIDLRSSSNSNISNETNNGKTIRSKILRAENKHELSNTITLAKKEVNESNVIKVTRSEIKPCNNSEIILYAARLDYLVEKQDDKE